MARATSEALYNKELKKGDGKKMSLETTPENLKRRSRSDVLRQSVPEARSSNQERPIANSGAAGSTDDQL
jgi:hypothetical protein